MNSHRLISSHFPYLPISVQVRGRIHDVEVLLDTGFDGDVALPAHLLATAHRPDGHLRWTLADGSDVMAPYYVGTAQFGQMNSFPVMITALGDEPIVGRATTDRFTITLDHGQRVILEP